VLKEASGGIEREIKGGKLPLWGLKTIYFFVTAKQPEQNKHLTLKSNNNQPKRLKYSRHKAIIQR
jgi:hypothetical protein